MSDVRAFPAIPTKILLPIDFSPSSQEALEIAADLAKRFEAELYLVNVIPFFSTATYPDFDPEARLLEKAKAQADRRLGKCHSVLEGKGVKSRYSVETGNDISGTLMEVADREHSEMVIISTHGISGWRPLVFGSIAERIVRLVECPLMLLHTAKPEVGALTPARRLMEYW